MNLRAMRSRIAFRRWWLLDLHPDTPALLAWADAEPGQRPSDITDHLACCSRCRARSLAMLAAISACTESRIELDEIYAQLDLRMRAWRLLGEPGQAAHQTTAGSRNWQLLQMIELYFGEGAAQRIKKSARADTSDHQLLPATQPLFYAFLGKRAGEAVVRAIADA